MTSHSLLVCEEEEKMNARDLARLRKLEFVHNIGLIPVLRMHGGETRDDGAEGANNLSGESARASGNSRGQKRGFDQVEPEVSTSDTTEPEDSQDDNEDDTSSTTGTLTGSATASQPDSDLEEAVKSKLPHVPVPRKSYQALLEENVQMKKQLETNSTEITELKRLHDVITDENNLLSLELQEVQKSAKEDKLRLESDLQETTKVKNVLHRRVEKLKQGIREMNEILADLIKQIQEGHNSNSTAVSVPRSPMSPGDSPQSTSSELQLALQRWKPSKETSPSTPTHSNLTSSFKGTPSPSSISTSPRRSRRPSSITKQINRCLECIPPYSPMLIQKSQESSQTKKSEEKSEPCKKSSPKNTKKPIHAVDEKRQHEGFYCICGTSVTSRPGLITHIKYHTFEGQFRCSVKGCGRRYFTTTCLRAHMKAKHGLVYNGREGCRTCGETFLSRMQLYVHCKTVHKCGPLLAHRKCSDSGATPPLPAYIDQASSKLKPTQSPNKKDIQAKFTIHKKHNGPVRNNTMYQIVHELDTTVEGTNCVCGREFTSNHNLQMHIKYFSYEPRFTCTACPKRYNGTNLLRQHMKSKHGMNYTGHGCRSCGRVFKTMATLYQHCRVSHNSGPFGNKNFLNRSQIAESVEKAATSVIIGSGGTSSSKRKRKVPSKYLEEFDGNASTGKGANRAISKLNSSQPVHTDDSSSLKGIKCTCGTAFTTRQALLNHIKLRTSQNIFKCKFCPCQFPRGDYLRNHVSLTHSALVKISNSKMATKRRHSGNESSSFQKSLESNRHGVASLDEEKKQFTCICGSEFVRRETLREHIRLKLGLTQFKCDLCNAMFWRHDYLKGHLQKVHDLLMSGFACRVCGQVGFESSNAVKKHHAVYHNKKNGTQDPLLTLPSEG